MPRKPVKTVEKGIANPYKFTPEVRAQLLDLIRKGSKICAAVKKVGISWETLRKHRAEDPEFAKEYQTAMQEKDSRMVDIGESGLVKAAKNGSVRACQVILYNRDPERWEDRKKPDVDRGLLALCLEDLVAMRRRLKEEGLVDVDTSRNGHG